MTDRGAPSDDELARLTADLSARASRADASPDERRALRDDARRVLRGFSDQRAAGGARSAAHRALAEAAFRIVGASADPTVRSVRDYDHDTYGPYLGVSDEGGAAEEIARAAAASPKARALGPEATALQVGLALDLERLGGVGEVVVGPDEYRDVWLSCDGRILLSTDVGTRVNVRNYLPPPRVTIGAGPWAEAAAKALALVLTAFKPFFETPDRAPRPVVVVVEFDLDVRRSRAQRASALRALVDGVERARSAGRIAASAIHRLALNVRIGWGRKGQTAAQDAVDLAREAGLTELTVDGVQSKAALRAGSLPGLLNYLPPGCVGPLLRHAKRRGVTIKPFDRVDADTVARGVWTTLFAARSMGLHLGKYALFPLTLEEGNRVVDHVNAWFEDWSAAPVFFAEQGLLTSDTVYAGRDWVKGLERWLDEMSQRNVRVVLIDTIDKSQGWKMLRSGKDKKGLLGPQQLARLVALAGSKKIKALWAGGITLPQAYEFGRLGVFGLYVTTAVSALRPVRGIYVDDPGMALRKQPTFDGVRRVKTLLEAGFLETRPSLAHLRDDLAGAVAPFLKALDAKPPREDAIAAAEQALATRVEAAWREHFRALGVATGRAG